MHLHLRKTSRWSSVMLLGAVLAGCNQGQATNEDAGGAPPPAEQPPAPVSVTFYMNGTEAGFFSETVAKMVKAQYPNITVKVIQPPGADFVEPLNAMIASKEPLPDVIVAGNGATSQLLDTKLLSDIAPLIKETKFDLARIRPELVKEMQSLSSKGEIFFVPYDVQSSVLFYNKDLFDKFGVPYPQNGITWDSLADITAKLSRVDGGTRYRGFDMLSSSWFNTPFSIPFYDAGKGVSTLDDPRWGRVLQAAKKLNDVPGNRTDAAMFDKGRDYFVKDRTLAMFPIGLSFMQQSIGNKSADGLHWDMAALPNYPDLPKISNQPTYHYMAITPNSPVKKEVMQIMSVMMKDENVKLIARAGREPVVDLAGLADEFGKDLPWLEGKNVSAFFYNRFAPSAGDSPYTAKIRSSLVQAYRSVLLDGVDINTALRTAKETADQAIKEMKN